MWFSRDAQEHYKHCRIKFPSLTQSARWKQIKNDFEHHQTSTLSCPSCQCSNLIHSMWLHGDQEELYAKIKLTPLAWLHFKTYFSWVNTIKEIIAGINYHCTEVKPRCKALKYDGNIALWFFKTCHTRNIMHYR